MKLWRIAVFLIAFVAFAIAIAPASLIARQSDAITFRQAAGAIWNGRLEGVKLGPYAADRLAWRVSLLDLLRGRLNVPFTIEGGELEGDGVFISELGGGKRLSIPELRAHRAYVATTGVEATTLLRDVEVVFADGACADARGFAESDALTRLGPLLGWTGPPMSGGVFCENGEAVLALSGANDAGARANLRAAFLANGGGRWQAAFGPVTTSVEQAPATALMQREGEMLTAQGEMRWLP